MYYLLKYNDLASKWDCLESFVDLDPAHDILSILEYSNPKCKYLVTKYSSAWS